MTDIQQILTKYWGYSSFRSSQEEIINSVLNGKDTLALLPTGGGKSVCFQVPAIAKEGICLVISPLIALIKDQVKSLNDRGIKAISIVSGMTKREIDIAFDNCIYGNFKFLYLSPERLLSDIAKDRISKMNINLLAVDEAHCISQWGYDFRPPYLQIATAKKQLFPNVPTLALTATATLEVVTDIQEKLEFKELHVIQKSFVRKNIAYVVLKEEDKLGRLFKIINKLNGIGIVYVRNRKKTQEVALFLNKNNITADFYHAGLTPEQRDTKQYNWQNNYTRIIVATNAFGMGIDKGNVRFVIHIELADSIESYFQEAGRAGRDEQKAYAIQLFSNSDEVEFRRKTAMSFPPISTIKNTYKALFNYYQLAIGSGKLETKNIDLADFSKKFNLTPIDAFNALKFLEKDGYIELSTTFFSPSKIMIIQNKEALYFFQIANKKMDGIIKLLLRSYSGLFDNYIKISEKELAQKSKTTIATIKEYLKQLHKLEIIDYSEQNNLPQLTFLKERLPINEVRISDKVYKDRKKIVFEKMEAMLTYAKSERKCRSQQLLAYFGETESLRCGICDVCLERNKLELSNYEFEQVSNQIKKILKNEILFLNQIVSQIDFAREDKIVKVVQWLIDNKKMIYTNDKKLKWV